MEDSLHVNEIDSLIPLAEKEATEKVEKLNAKSEIRFGKDGGERKHCFWTEFFHAAMNRYANEAGLRSC